MKRCQCYFLLFTSVMVTSLVNLLIYREGKKFQSFVASIMMAAPGGGQGRQHHAKDLESKQYLQTFPKDDEDSKQILQEQDENNNSPPGVLN
jgi:hypothetical protein